MLADGVIIVAILGVDGPRVQIGIERPKEISVDREDVYLIKKRFAYRPPQKPEWKKMNERALPASSFECPKCHAVSHNPNDATNCYCGRCHQFVEDMRNEQVTDFKHITDLYLTRKDCFTLAMLTLADSGNRDCRLVHGIVTSSFTGEAIQHAWCEMPAIGTYEDGSGCPITMAIDLTQLDERARIVPADLLYEKTRARNLKRFTLAEAIAQALTAGRDGPWACSPFE